VSIRWKCDGWGPYCIDNLVVNSTIGIGSCTSECDKYDFIDECDKYDKYDVRHYVTNYFPNWRPFIDTNSMACLDLCHKRRCEAAPCKSPHSRATNPHPYINTGFRRCDSLGRISGITGGYAVIGHDLTKLLLSSRAKEQAISLEEAGVIEL